MRPVNAQSGGIGQHVCNLQLHGAVASSTGRVGGYLLRGVSVVLQQNLVQVKTMAQVSKQIRPHTRSCVIAVKQTNLSAKAISGRISLESGSRSTLERLQVGSVSQVR